MGARDLARFAGLAAARRYRALWLHCLRPGTFDLTQQLPFIPGLAWPSNVRLTVAAPTAPPATAWSTSATAVPTWPMPSLRRVRCQGSCGRLQSAIDYWSRRRGLAHQRRPRARRRRLERHGHRVADERHGSALCPWPGFVDVRIEASAERASSQWSVRRRAGDRTVRVARRDGARRRARPVDDDTSARRFVPGSVAGTRHARDITSRRAADAVDH